MHFRDRLRRGEQLIGTLLTLGSAQAAEILSHSDFDWLFVDLEHSAMGPNEAQSLLQAVGSTPTLVRVESRDETGIRKALDLGATGIIVPQVSSRAEAERIVSLAKYAPMGQRSVGLGRATNYGNNFAEYVQRANDETVVVLQIEHIDAVNCIEEIASVAGVDAFFVGPYDLSGSLGQLGELEAPAVVAAIDRAFAAARERQIAIGIFAGSSPTGRRYLERGFTLVAVGTDGMLLGRAAAAELSALRG